MKARHFAKFAGFSAVRPLSNPVERGGVWTGPDGRSDYLEIDRGAQERGGFSNGSEHNGPEFCKSCRVLAVNPLLNPMERSRLGRALTHGPVFR
jgi:hypothetical protein